MSVRINERQVVTSTFFKTVLDRMLEKWVSAFSVAMSEPQAIKLVNNAYGCLVQRTGIESPIPKWVILPDTDLSVIAEKLANHYLETAVTDDWTANVESLTDAIHYVVANECHILPGKDLIDKIGYSKGIARIKFISDGISIPYIANYSMHHSDPEQAKECSSVDGGINHCCPDEVENVCKHCGGDQYATFMVMGWG